MLGAVDGAGRSGASVGAGAPVPEPPDMKPSFYQDHGVQM